MCKSEEHCVDTCQYKERAYEWAFQLRLKDEKIFDKSSKHSSSRKETDRVANNRRTHLNRQKEKKTAYVAQDIDSEVYESYSKIESDDEDDDNDFVVAEEGMMAFSDETPRGKPRSSSPLPMWHADTAASSHMTDNPKNFKGPLRPTR